MSEVMLINVVDPEETRVAILEDNELEELYLERAAKERIVGNIYKGIVTNIEANIEAAFVDFGYRKHGFLHVSDIRDGLGRSGPETKKGQEGPRKDISSLLREGQQILVQVTKEGMGDKGPALSTYLSLPGRCLVLMPGTNLRGVSRKIADPAERERLRRVIKELDVPADMGLIARTASEEKTKRELERDLDYLLKLWKVVDARARKSGAPALVFQESDQVIRAIRDIFGEEISEIVVDSEEVFNKVKEFLRAVMPQHVRQVKLHEAPEPLFHTYGIDAEIQKMNSRTVTLANGGSIVLEQAEALVAVDVNSGRFKGQGDAEQTAFRINMKAAREIARQIRLRDLGGVLAIDFIDMQDEKHRTAVEKELWNALKRDRARFRMLRMSPFCIVEMTRQRRRASFHQAIYVECPTCKGKGHVKSPETLGLEVVRKLRVDLARNDIARVEVRAAPTVANYLNNTMRSKLRSLEESTGKEIKVIADPGRRAGELEIKGLKEGGRQVAL